MMEYHGTCTVLAMTRRKTSTQLKLLLGGLTECVQDNFPLGQADWVNAFADNILTKSIETLTVGKQIKVTAISNDDSLELKHICLI